MGADAAAREALVRLLTDNLWERNTPLYFSRAKVEYAVDGVLTALAAAGYDTTPRRPTNVYRHLDLSTRHLWNRDDNLNGYDGVRASATADGGWWVWVPDMVDEHFGQYEEEDFPGPPDELIGVLRYARTLGCDYVNFDPDGPIDPNLPTWELV